MDRAVAGRIGRVAVHAVGGDGVDAGLIAGKLDAELIGKADLPRQRPDALQGHRLA
jgi:hypothetical protein